jgi:hypothetical protein
VSRSLVVVTAILTVSQPIYTDAYLCDVNTLNEINRFLQAIDQLASESEEMPLDWELVLELSNDEETEKRIWSYYFINHSDRALFWLHDIDARIILNGLPGVSSRAHIRMYNFY